jgi:hypothetical protein
VTRAALALRDGDRVRVRATIQRFGLKTSYGYTKRTILLVDVRDAETGTPLADHLWLTAGKWTFMLREGSMIEFTARIGPYIKGYRGRREDVDAPISLDWRLQRPTKVQLIREPEMQP